MWKYIAKQTVRHSVNGLMAVLTVTLLIYLLSGGAQWALGEGALVYICG